jgi:hypothetical protein
LSVQMDQQKLSERNEIKIRTHLNGWSPTSSTGEIYTRRHVRRSAGRAGLDFQARMMKGKKVEK